MIGSKALGAVLFLQDGEEKGGYSLNQDTFGFRCPFHEGAEMLHIAGQQVRCSALEGSRENGLILGREVERASCSGNPGKDLHVPDQLLQPCMAVRKLDAHVSAGFFTSQLAGNPRPVALFGQLEQKGGFP